jgi:toxin YhaV
VYAWVNDEQSLRSYGSTRDAYAVFAGMLDAGNPPSDWDALLAAASGSTSGARLHALKQTKGRGSR